MNKIILALDTTNLEEAISITKKVKNKIFSVKVGLELFNSFGKEGIKKFNEMGITNLMLDLKLKDIPQTVYKAIKALDNIEFGYITVHGQGGKEMIEKAKKAAIMTPFFVKKIAKNVNENWQISLTNFDDEKWQNNLKKKRRWRENVQNAPIL